jgi:glycosyltransferase involved in cell wall biosynthesis
MPTTLAPTQRVIPAREAAATRISPFISDRLPPGLPAPPQPIIPNYDDVWSRRGRPLRVLMVVESAAGGTGRHVLDLCDGLIARGCEVHLIHSTRRIDQPFRDRLTTIKGLHHQGLPLRTCPHPADLAATLAIRRYLQTLGPFDAAHGHSSKGGALARLAALGLRPRVPAFYTLHGLIMMDPGLPCYKSLVYSAVELGLGLATSRIIAVSPEESRAATRMGLGRSKVTLIPNGIGPQQLTPRLEARHTLGIDTERDRDATVIGFVGRLVSQKAPDTLLKAFATTAQVAPGARLAMVGSGPLEPTLRKLTLQLGIVNKVLWLGERDARTVLAGFDVFALPSRKEGLPYVALEAMVAGLPVVATQSAGVEILIDPGVSGAVVPTDDPSSMALALIGLVNDPNRRLAYSHAARQRAARFTVDAMVDRTLETYLSAVSMTKTNIHR